MPFGSCHLYSMTNISDPSSSLSTIKVVFMPCVLDNSRIIATNARCKTNSKSTACALV